MTAFAAQGADSTRVPANAAVRAPMQATGSGGYPGEKGFLLRSR